MVERDPLQRMAPLRSLLLIGTVIADAALLYLVLMDGAPLDRRSPAWLALFAGSGALLFVSWLLGGSARPGLGWVVPLLGCQSLFLAASSSCLQSARAHITKLPVRCRRTPAWPRLSAQPPIATRLPLRSGARRFA